MKVLGLHTPDLSLEGGRNRRCYSNIYVCDASFVSGLLQSTPRHAPTKDVLGDEVVEAVLMGPLGEDGVKVPRINLPNYNIDLKALLDEA